MAKDIDKQIEEIESQVRQSLGEEEPPEAEGAPPVEESEEPKVEDSAEEPVNEQEEATEVEEKVEPEKCQECERLKAELETANKRIRDTQSHMHTATTEASRMRKEILELKADNAKLEGKLKAQKQEDETDSQLAELYPEVAGELKKRDKQIESYTERIERLERERGEDAEKRKHDEDLRARAFLQQRHPDTPQIIPTDEFQNWVKGHRYFNHIASTLNAHPTIENVEDIVAIMDEFKDSLSKEEPPVTEDPVDKAKKLATPKSKNKARQPDIKPKEGVRYSLAALKKMTPEQYAKVSEDVDKAFVEGRVDP